MSDAEPALPAPVPAVGSGGCGSGPVPAYAEIALRALSEGIVMQLATGEIVACNPAAERILGLTRDQLSGRTSVDPRWQAVHEDGSPFPGETHPAMVTLRTGESLRGVVMGVHRPDGSLRWISINTEPVAGPEGRPSAVVATFVDITERRALEEASRREAEERRRAEDALRANEQNLRGFFDAIDDCGFVLDGEGRILHVNRGTTARLGWSREELVGRTVLEVHPEDRREEAARIVAAMVAGEASLCPVPLLARGGKLIPVETRVFPGQWDGQAALFGLSKDLSELRASEEKFQKIFRNNPCPMVLRSMATGRVVDVNQAFVETLGHRREDVVGLVAVGMRAVVDAERRDEAEILVRTRGAFRDFEMDVATADGRTLHGLFSGEVIQLQDEQLLVTVMKDVTELRRAEAELRRHRDHLEELVAERTAELARKQQLLEQTGRLARVGGWEVDLRTGAVTWSDVVREIHEVQAGSAVGSGGALDFVAPEWMARGVEVFRRAVDLGEPFDEEVELVTARGRRIWVRAIGHPHREDGTVVRVGGVLQDIHERKLAEEELRRHRDQLAELVADRTAELARSQRLMAEAERLAHIGSFRWDVTTQKVTWSDGMFALFGIDRGGFDGDLARVIETRVHPEDRARLVAIAEAAYRDRTVPSVEFRVLLPGGTVRTVWCECEVERTGSGEDRVLIGFVQDVTENRDLQRALHEAAAAADARAEELAAMMEAVPAIVFVAHDPACERMTLSRAGARMLGLEPGANASMSAPVPERPATFRPVKDGREVPPEELPVRMAARGIPVKDAEVTLEMNDGTRRVIVGDAVPLFDRDGALRGAIGAFLDMTERKRAEEALRTSEQRFREVLESSLHASYKRDLRTDTYAYLSPVLERIIGYAPDELEALPVEAVLALIHPEDAREVERVLAESMVDPARQAFQLTYRLRHRTGPWVWLEDRFTVLRDTDGRPLARVGSIADITERKRIEAELARHQDRLEELVVQRTAALVESREHLLRSETRLRLALQAANSGTYEWNVRTNQVLWTPELERLYGLQEGGFAGQYDSGETFIHPEDLPAVRALLRKAVEDRTGFHGEFRIVRPDGETRWMEGFGTIVCDEAGSPLRMIGLNRDITEKKHAELELRRSREEAQDGRAKLAAALASMTDAVFISDTSGRFIEFNEAFATFHRFRSKADCALHLAEYPALLDVFLDTGELAPFDMWAVPRALRGETVANAEYTLRLKATGETWVGSYNFGPIRDAGGAIVGSVVVASDITERKKTQQALRESHEMLERRVEERTAQLQREQAFVRNLLNSIPDLVFFKDLEGVYGGCNPAFAEFLGRTEAEIVGRKDHDLIAPEVALFFRQQDALALEQLRPRHNDEWISYPDGRRVLLDTLKTPYYGPSGEVLGILGISRDITARHEAEEQVQRLAADLERRVVERTALLEDANRELEAYSYSVSHELRTPLRAIDGYAALIAQVYAGVLDEEGRRLFGQVRANAQRMGRLIDDLLAFSRAGRADLSFETVDMAEAVRSALARVAPDAAALSRIALTLGELPAATGDGALLQRVWENLLSNAIKFSSTRPRPRISVEGTVVGGDAVYRVSDNGVGFDMKYVGKLFGVFHRLHGFNEFEGTGVGLALVRRVVVRHGGRVWAEGEPDRGATFFFSLPVT